MTLVSKTFELYGKTYTLETGELAKQATGAVSRQQGDTTCSLPRSSPRSARTTTSSRSPSTSSRRCTLSAASRAATSSARSRPSEKGTLTARMIDRPIRPSFPDGFRNEVHIVATTLVATR